MGSQLIPLAIQVLVINDCFTYRALATKIYKRENVWNSVPPLGAAKPFLYGLNTYLRTRTSFLSPAPLPNAHAHEEKYGWLARLVTKAEGGREARLREIEPGARYMYRL